MSAATRLQAAVVARLRAGCPGLSAVFDAPPVRAVVPHAIVPDPVAVDWSTKDAPGCEARLVATIIDAGERPVRLRALLAAADAALATLPADLGDGWRLVTLVPVRCRLVLRGAGQWTGSSEWRARMLRAAGEE